MQQIRNFVIIFCVICANSFAQDSGNFSEKTLPDNSAKAPVVNQVKAESDSAKTSEISKVKAKINIQGLNLQGK